MSRLLTLPVFLLALLLTTVGVGQSAKPLDGKQLETIWADFIQNDEAGTRKAIESIRIMKGSPKLAVPFLKERLKVVPPLNPKKIAQCIADLDHKDFETREKASKDLATMGDLVTPALERKRAEKDLSPEVSGRLDVLLGKLEKDVLTAGDLRTHRAILTLQEIGTPEAKAVLESLSNGAEGAWSTQCAKKALAQLASQTSAK